MPRICLLDLKKKIKYSLKRSLICHFWNYWPIIFLKIFPTAYTAVQSYNGVTPQNQQQWCQNHPTIMSFNHAEPEKVCNKFRKGPKPKSEAEVVAPDLFMKLACLYQQGPSARQVYFCYLKESLPKDLWIYGKNTQIPKYILGGTQKPF